MTLCPGRYGISIATQGCRAGDWEGQLLSFCITIQSAANDKDIDGSGPWQNHKPPLSSSLKRWEKALQAKTNGTKVMQYQSQTVRRSRYAGTQPALILSLCLHFIVYIQFSFLELNPDQGNILAVRYDNPKLNSLGSDCYSK